MKAPDRLFPDNSSMDINLALSLLALVFFSAALALWVTAWFLREKDGFAALVYAVIFGFAGFTTLIFWRITAH